MKPFLLTTAAMIAFALNTIFCRWALGRDFIDAASFTGIRLFSGALVLLLILRLQQGKFSKPNFDWPGSAALFLYAVPFSFAYTDLATGTGALILFGFVQLSMIAWGLFRGDRPHPLAWAGMSVAIAGLVYLFLPGVSAPPPVAAVLMTIAGIAWGAYSLRGRGHADPTAATTWNFVGTLPMISVVLVFSVGSLDANLNGVVLAILSGAVASGMGYAIWYTALPYLTPTQAANVQLSVPVLAAFGGVLAMNEAITLRLVIASLLILGGIAVVILSRTRKNPSPPPGSR